VVELRKTLIPQNKEAQRQMIKLIMIGFSFNSLTGITHELQIRKAAVSWRKGR